MTTISHLTTHALRTASPAVDSPSRACTLTRSPIAVLASQFPCLSETFVLSDISGLQQRGWTVIPTGLREGTPDTKPLTSQHLFVYRGRGRLLSAFLAELIRHPLRSARTLLLALADALAPAEKTAPRDRVKGLFQAFSSIALAPALRAAGIRHLHCHFAHSPTTIGMYAAAQLAIPFSFTGHANDLFQNRILLTRKLQRAAFVGAISQWHRDLYASLSPATAAKLRIIRCGVDVATWRTAPRTPNTAQIHLISVCRLVEKKGMDVLIRALPSLQKSQGPKIKLTIVGDGPERQSLSRLADDLHCADMIDWAGPLPHDAVRARLAEADIFVLPCKTDRNGDRDGIPVALMEAMAHSIPVVSGDLPAIRELVADNDTGRLVPENDPAALAAALQNLIADAPQRARLANAGRRRVEEEFSRNMNLDRLESAILEALGSHRSTL